MYSGTITLITDFNEPSTNPRIGCRLGFLGGEFYINKTEHTWQYGSTPTIKLHVSRGMIYDKSGKMITGQNGIMCVADQYAELRMPKEIEAEDAVIGEAE
jgi:hypothetical protein